VSVNPGEIHVTDRMFLNYAITIVDFRQWPHGAGGVTADQHTVDPPELVNYNGEWIKTYFEERKPRANAGRAKKIFRDGGEWRSEYVRD